MIRLVNIDGLSPASPAWEDVLKLEIWEPKDVVLWYLTQNNIKRIDDTRKGCEKTYELVRRGKWITMSDADGTYWACSECGEDIPRISHYNPQFDLFPRLESIGKTNYCPNCGAKMEEGSVRNNDE